MSNTPTSSAQVAEGLNLMPCPFCQSHAQTDFIEGKSYIIECYACDARTGCHDSAEDAIAAWNRRTAAPVAEGVALPPLAYMTSDRRHVIFADAIARHDTAGMIPMVDRAPYAERIRQLERELAERK